MYMHFNPTVAIYLYSVAEWEARQPNLITPLCSYFKTTYVIEYPHPGSSHYHEDISFHYDYCLHLVYICTTVKTK